MRTRRKKEIQLPITSRRETEGGALRTILIACAMIAAGGLLYAYLKQPDLLEHLTSLELGKSLIATPHL